MAFTQKLFTTYQPYGDGNVRIGELNRIWYDSIRNAFYISDGATPGGVLIGTGGGNGNVIISGGNYSNVNVNAWFSANIAASLYSNVNLAAYLSTASIGGNLDLGNLYITDETIGGKIANRDITLLPSGTGLVSMPGFKVPVGSIVQGVSNITAVVTSTVISQVERYSTGPSDNLNTGDYGLTNGISGVTPGWTVYQAYGNVTFGNTIQIGDSFVGAGIPGSSTVLFVGNISGTDPANANVIITSYTLNNLPPVTANTLAFTTRNVVNAGFAITTQGNTDITLNPGIGGNIVPAGSIIPLVSGVYNLGTPTRRFKELWLGAGTIYVQDETLGTDQIIGARDGNLYVGGGTGFTVGKFTLTGNTIALLSSTEDFYIGTQYATGNLNIRRPFQVLNNSNNVGFQVERNGLTIIKSPATLGLTQSVFSIIGTMSGNVQARNFANTMMQVTGNDNYPTRVSFDAFGVTGTQNAYVAVAARAARGTVDAPTTTQAGDTIMRFTAQGWTGNGLYAGSILRLNFEAAETFTSNLKTGTRLTIATTPVGSNLIQTTAAFYSNGVNLYGNTVTTGVTFADTTFQNTAWVPSDSVRKITTGTGFLNPGTYQGNVSLDTIDVHTLISDSYSLTVSDLGSNNLKLHLAQEIASNSSPTFNNLTVSNLTVNGTFTTATNASILGKILYLANNSTMSSQIDGGGIVLGNVQQSYNRHLLYSLTGTHGDYWYTDSDTGFQTEHLVATDAYLTGNIDVAGTGRFGGAYTGYNFPNAGIQVFENVNSYAQIVEQNLSTGTAASTDFIATSNNGTDTAFYVDLGINGSNFDNTNPTNSLGTSTDKNDAYLYIQGNLSNTSSPGGNLTVGVNTPGRVIKFIAGGGTVSDIVATFSNTSLSTPKQIISTVATGTAPLVIASGTKVNNLYAARAAQADSLNPGATINGVQFFGNSAITVGANASMLTGTYLASTVIGSSLQTVGNLISLNVTGNINGGSWLVTQASASINGNVYTNYIIANGSYLTALPGYAYSNVNVKAYTETMGFTNFSNVNVYAYLNANYYLTSNTANLANYAWNANVTSLNTAFTLANTIQSNQINAIIANVGNLQTNAYSNVNVLAYTSQFGSFWDDTTVTANTAIVNNGANIRLANTYGNLGVYITNGSHIQFSANGTYRIDYSLQFQNTDNKQHSAIVWLRKNGVNIPNSSSYFTMMAQGSVNGYVCAVGPFIDGTITTSDYYQIAWSCESAGSGSVILGNIAATGPAPSSPAAIVTVTKI